ncbi:hypothetical protein [Haladaptatus sp. T7]|uniref:hypothetical protein n=1 Tax=Haladaptatus sp. T7 TaxID=2029368 RepID=UPI0022328C55|nr:hypothetical protein [Haladaptatus sp. T7]
MHRRSFLSTSAPVAVATLADCSNPCSTNDPTANDLSIAVDGMPNRSRIWHATDCHHLTITIREDSVKFAEKTC